MNYTSTFFDGLLHLFFPQTCIGCGNDIIMRDELLCTGCTDNLPLTNFHLYSGNPLEKVFTGRLRLHAAAALMYFSKQSVIQHLLHALKYKGNREIGLHLGRMMGQLLNESPRFQDLFALIPLPLHPSRLKRRGYNQAEVICTGLAEQLKIPVISTAVKRIAKTSTQTHKGRMERWENMEGRFAVVDEAVIRHKHVLLVDDVITTGATLESCGSELLKVPGLQLSIASIAYTSS